ncbi:dNTP-hexose glycosyl transferase [Streptomyces spinoverrucosus]|uniref:DNTP-hexose glycosyl transferase n=1 Tax=Streptomyces spinoverrucosus TaxID=284043 RepID=A0A4Y3V8C8_9ACTN|nr:nucleotide disphospho-sugar-binding domain-containing protein [Streptomyces spinoverrucosus]GEC03472.1 dNTP-hexose glycosyl transferase [Streptomyces spinoverrucosus]
MRILFLAGGSPATIFGLAPLATAARNAGHQVFLASTEEMMPVAAGAGLPGVPVTGRSIRDFMTTSRTGESLQWPEDPQEHIHFIGRGFGRMAADSLPALTELGRAWKADLVVGGMLCFAAPLAARHLGIPYVRQAWDTGEPPEVDGAAASVMGPELAELGLDRLPEHDLYVDICPPSLRPADAFDAQPMRYIPGNGQRALEPWMYVPGERRRILVTAGSRVSRHQYFDYVRELARKVGALGTELLVAVPDDVADELTEGLRHVRAGWMPLDVVAPTCDLVVHHAGGGTALSAMNAGVPQLLIPNMPKLVPPSRRLVDFGAALMVPDGEDSQDAVVAACEKILGDSSYRERSQALAAEIAGMPLPAQVVGALEDLVG